MPIAPGSAIFGDSSVQELAPVVAYDWSKLQGWLGILGGVVALVAYLRSRSDSRKNEASSVFLAIYGMSGDTASVALTNGSRLPVYNAHIWALSDGRPRRTWRFRRVRNWWSSDVVDDWVYLNVPPCTVTPEVPYNAPPPPESQPALTFGPVALLTFRDGNGRQWVRWPNGRLSFVWVLRTGQETDVKVIDLPAASPGKNNNAVG